MSYLIFNNLIDLTGAATPSSGYTVAYDLDGIIKQKDVFGNVTPIAGSGGGSFDVITSNNSGLNITLGITNSLVDTLYNTSLDSTLSMPTSVGGISAGTTVASLSSKNFVQLFDDLLFPTVSPTYTIPTITIVSSVTGIVEIGLTVSPTITLTGVENDAGPFSQLVIRRNENSIGNVSIATVSSTASMLVVSVANIAAQFGYTDPNNPNLSYQISTSETFPIPSPLSGGSSTVVYSGLGNYDIGIAKRNNKGVTHSALPALRTTTSPQSPGSNFASSNQIITGYYPYFYGKSATQQNATQIKSIIESGSSTKVVNNAAGSLIMAFNAVGEWPWFAIFDSFSTKTTWYENALNNGNIGGVTDLFASPTTLSITSPDGYWIVNYKIYPANKVTTISTATIS